MLRGISGVANYLIFFANLIVLFHIWWGASFLFTKVSLPKGVFDWLIAFTILIVLMLNAYYITNAKMWFLIYSVNFSLVVLWYSRYTRYKLNNMQKEYLKTKIRVEMGVILFFFLGFLNLALFNFEWNYLFGAYMAVIGQIPFIIYLVFIKKVYNIC